MDKPLRYKCGHCMGPFTDFEDCVSHLCAVHPHEELYIMVAVLNETTGMRSYIPRQWKYTPADCNVEGWELKGTSDEKIRKYKDPDSKSADSKKPRECDEEDRASSFSNQHMFSQMHEKLNPVLIELEQAGHLNQFEKFLLWLSRVISQWTIYVFCYF